MSRRKSTPRSSRLVRGVRLEGRGERDEDGEGGLGGVEQVMMETRWKAIER